MQVKAEVWNKNKWIILTNPEKLKDMFSDILLKAGFSIINFQEHFFKPTGYTALWLLSESHFAIHTFPEENKSYIELSSCGREHFCNFLNILEQYGL